MYISCTKVDKSNHHVRSCNSNNSYQLTIASAAGPSVNMSPSDICTKATQAAIITNCYEMRGGTRCIVYIFTRNTSIRPLYTSRFSKTVRHACTIPPLMSLRRTLKPGSAEHRIITITLKRSIFDRLLVPVASP